ncbi:MAG: dethiobiotin synthase [Candidatus Omnitrophota bacterium]|nr:dethiobiotin synthase [Candidatus Omnitrophota bacterium]
MVRRALFITATDTGVGKTMATFVLGTLLKSKGIDVGVMKPVQCGGNDAAFLKKALELDDDIDVINPCYAPEPLSPHLAFRRAGQKVDVAKIRRAYTLLRRRHDVVLIEGAGGLMVPLKNNYYNADLIRDLNAEVIIVSRLGLGTINHTLLTIDQAKSRGLKIKGVLFSDTGPGPKGIAEQTNPAEIKRLSGVRMLGTIPYLSAGGGSAFGRKQISVKEVLKKCRNIAVD